MKKALLGGALGLLLLAHPAFLEAVPIYRSVGPSNTAAMDTGAADSNAMSISASVASFSNSIPAHVGVGDVIQYDLTGDATPDVVAFIHSRISETQYTVRTVLGFVPPDRSVTTDWSIFRAYTALAFLRNGTENAGIDPGVANFDPGNRDLVSNDENFYVACYNDAVDTTPTTWMSWTSDASHQIKIYTPYLPSEVGISQRHQGKYTTDGYRIEVTNNRPLTLRDAYFQVEGLQLFSNNPGTADRIGVYYDTSVNAGGLKLSHCIIKGNSAGSMGGYYGVQLRDNVSSDFYVWNNIIYGFNVTNSTSGGGICMTDTGNNVYAYNNTIYDCKVGIEQLNGDIIAKNNITQLCTDGYSGAFDASSTSNVSDIASDAPGLNPLAGRAYFVEENDPGNLDFHLNPFDTLAKDNGADLSSDPNWPFGDDIDRETRSGSWDVGADEVPSGPTATPTATITPSRTVSATPSATVTQTPSATATPTTTVTATTSMTFTVTKTATTSPTQDINATATPSPTQVLSTPTPTVENTPTSTPTITLTTNPLADVDLDWKVALAYPNPARTEVRFLIHFSKPSEVRIEVYNPRGERVSTIQESFSAGNGQFLTWDCQDVAPGLYLAKIVINGKVREVKKIAVLK